MLAFNHSIGATHLSNRCHPPFGFFHMDEPAMPRGRPPLAGSNAGIQSVPPTFLIGATHLLGFSAWTRRPCHAGGILSVLETF